MVADITMSLLQEQQRILEELLLNTSAQPSASPTSMESAKSSEEPVTLGSAHMEKSAVSRM